MKLIQLNYFLAIVDAHSMSQAAKRLFITQPALSQSIHELEEELGITLFTRNSKGMSLTNDGIEFLSYARQMIQQADLIKRRYQIKRSVDFFSISAQHYSFVVEAFAKLVEERCENDFKFQLKETRTNEVFLDVSELRSEIGIIFITPFNFHFLMNHMEHLNLDYYPLFRAKPHVFLSSNNPLAHKKEVTFAELACYPYLSYEQGTMNSVYFNEEALSNFPKCKEIIVSDRATLFNLLIGINGYTISTGIINSELNGENICSVLLAHKEHIEIGYVTRKFTVLSDIGKRYLELLKKVIHS
ncbi:MAG: LysR family transcriptional regulator [Lactobacillales bacterium]|jgi:DNA-binding transcriptional LysR family regulator|nr:LysR family transcriptional regulator [Lactobacillales bacterium]